MSELFDTTSQWQADLSGTLLIEASAGTGKTFTIGNLYLRHILGGRMPSEILVVSFTNAATDELKLRIRRRLAEACQLFENPLVDDEFLQLLASDIESASAEERAVMQLRLQLALRHMDEAAIFTIHGFCQIALNEFALLGNRHFEQQIVTDDNELWDQALKDWWRQLCYPMPETHWQLIMLSEVDLATISNDLKELRRHRSQRFIPEDNPSLPRLLEGWDNCSNSLQQLAVEWHEHRSIILEALENSAALSQARNSPLATTVLPGLFTILDNYFAMSQPLLLPGELWHLSIDAVNEACKPSKRGQDDQLDQPFFHSVQQIRDQVSSLQRSVNRRLRIDAYDYCGERVRQLKARGNLVSFDDQIDQLLEALRSSTGEDLGQQICSRFPVAMIDEFQDTDAAQYELFDRIYHPNPGSCLGLIGDPKQAIYGFRGADIFTYISVSQDPAIRHYSLQTNWRSDPDLIQAVNGVFANRDDAFVFGQSIPFLPALAAPRERTDQLKMAGNNVNPLTMWQLPVAENGKALSNSRLMELIHDAICYEIKRLLAEGQIDGKAVSSGDIAILVRSAWQGEALRAVLLEHGLNAISIGRDSIFASAQARQLLELLEAISSPFDDRLARRARSNGLYGLPYQQLATELTDDQWWQGWLSTLNSLHERWHTHGFVAMFSELLHGFDLPGAITKQPQAERKLTNLLHLGELLINQSKNTPGMEPLMAWFGRQIDLPDNDEAELRLESDESLIKIITIHKSKGLEYPVVFMPYTWDARHTARDTHLLRFHDAQGQAVIDLDSESREAHWLVADKERLAEDLRLLYVALTRARSRVYLAFGHAGLPGKKTCAAASAMSWLLAAEQSSEQLLAEPVSSYGPQDELSDKLQTFAARQPFIDLLPLPCEITVEKSDPQLTAADFEGSVRNFGRQFTLAWRVNSFSGLTRDVHQATKIDGSTKTTDPILNFEAGSQVGLLIHALLEALDFSGDISAQSSPLIQSLSVEYGLRSTGQDAILIDWLQQIVNTPLDSRGLSLSQISNPQRLNELGFDYPVGLFDTRLVNQLLQRFSEIPLPALVASDFTGIMTGSIDLVFEHGGQFYLADYKSNLLGKSLTDYLPARLMQAMAERRYDLQLLIYALAMHRYLRQRITGYSYDQHFGGCYYLFLRGMRVRQGNQYGIYFHRPPVDLINQLDQLLSTGHSSC